MIHKIKALHDNGRGLSVREITRRLNLSRNTVRKYLRMSPEEISEQETDTQRVKRLDECRDYLIHLLQRYPKLSAVKLQRKLKEVFPALDVSDRTSRRYVAQLKREVVCKQARYYEPVLDMVPGVQCQVDAGELREVVINGEATTVYFVVFVLSWSRLMYVGLSTKPLDTPQFIALHDAAFRAFGGCVQECVYDQTTLVVLREEYRELTLNARFHEYATHAGFAIRACEGYDPESKGKVEAGVKYVKQSALYGERFESWSALEAAVSDWLAQVANVRCHGTTKEVPQQRYESVERARMRPYNTPACLTQREEALSPRKADKTGLISWQASKYSVPLAYQGQTVGVQVQAGSLLIHDLYSGQEIARHPLSEDKGKISKNRHHYRDLEQHIDTLESALRLQAGEVVGERLCALLKATSPKIYKDQLLGVKTLLEAHGALDAALEERLCALARLTATSLRDYLQAWAANDGRYGDSPPDRTAVTADTATALRRYSALAEVQHDVG